MPRMENPPTTATAIADHLDNARIAADEGEKRIGRAATAARAAKDATPETRAGWARAAIEQGMAAARYARRARDQAIDAEVAANAYTARIAKAYDLPLPDYEAAAAEV